MLIELRVRPGDFRCRSLLRKVSTNGLVRDGKVARVPHMSLYGNAQVPDSDWPSLRNHFEKVCSKYEHLPYVLDNYVTTVSRKGNVVAFGIRPSSQLLSFRRDIVSTFCKKFPSNQPWDQDGKEAWFHISIGWNLSDRDLFRVKDLLDQEKTVPYLPLDGLRVAILGRGGRIDREYDLIRKKLLTREQALDTREWCRTLRAYREKKGMKLTRKPLSSIWRGQKTFFISDLHLDHGNIIKYCARPFCKDIGEMNRVLINNWNYTVRNNDKIYFLGDISYGPDRKPSSYWWPRLNGQKIFVKGNHDDNSVPNIASDTFQVWDKYEKDTKYFAVVHDPNEQPDKIREWVSKNKAWLIHGDKHNDDISHYPFIDTKKRTINVSCELINYKPINLDLLLSLRLSSISRIDNL